MGKKNDVPKDIADAIIESVDSCGKVDDWRELDNGYYRQSYRLTINDVSITATRHKNYTKYFIVSGNDYSATIGDVEYQGANAKKVFECVFKNYKEKCEKVDEERKENELRKQFRIK